MPAGLCNRIPSPTPLIFALIVFTAFSFEIDFPPQEPVRNLRLLHPLYPASCQFRHPVLRHDHPLAVSSVFARRPAYPEQGSGLPEKLPCCTRYDEVDALTFEDVAHLLGGARQQRRQFSQTQVGIPPCEFDYHCVIRVPTWICRTAAHRRLQTRPPDPARQPRLRREVRDMPRRNAKRPRDDGYFNPPV